MSRRRLKLTRLCWDRESRPGPGEFFSGDHCPNCAGTIGIDKTRKIPKENPVLIVRYMKCDQCGFLPGNKLVEPIAITSEVVPPM